jgi:hypothetical protein
MLYNFGYNSELTDNSNAVFNKVIFVAGDSAAVGGFTVDNNFIDDAQAQSCTADNHNPYVHFTEAQLAEAELERERIGYHPWYRGWHACEMDGNVIAPWIQDFTREMYSADSQTSLLEALGFAELRHCTAMETDDI